LALYQSLTYLLTETNDDELLKMSKGLIREYLDDISDELSDQLLLLKNHNSFRIIFQLSRYNHCLFALPDTSCDNDSFADNKDLKKSF